MALWTQLPPDTYELLQQDAKRYANVFAVGADYAPLPPLTHSNPVPVAVPSPSPSPNAAPTPALETGEVATASAAAAATNTTSAAAAAAASASASAAPAPAAAAESPPPPLRADGAVSPPVPSGIDGGDEDSAIIVMKWMHEFNLQGYEHTFASNNIRTAADFTSLTHDDLRRMCIVAEGHLRRFSMATAALAFRSRCALASVILPSVRTVDVVLSSKKILGDSR